MDHTKLAGAFKEKWSCLQVAALAPLLSDQAIEAACLRLGHRWRQSPFPPGGGGAFATLPRAFA
jgi:hypothetical protein